jgi:hypothetical protein
MAPWSRCPRHRRSPLVGCSGGALRCEQWCDLAASIFDTFGWVPWCLCTLLARRTRTAIFWLVCGILRNGLRTVLHGIFQWCAILLPLVHISSIGHQGIPYIGMGHPKGDVCFLLVAFLFSPSSTYPETMKFTMFAYHGFVSVTLSSMPSRRKSFIGSSYMLVTCKHDRWSATVFFTPFLSFISRSNS